MDKKLVVMKFGGTSVGTSDAIRKVGAIVQTAMKENNVIVVVSAMNGVTDEFIQLTETKENGEKTPVIFKKLKELRERHLTVAEKLLSGVIAKKTIERLYRLLKDCAYTLVSYQPTFSLFGRNRWKDSVVSFGEKLSAQIVGDHLAEITGKGTVLYADTSQLIITDDNFGNAHVDFEKTNERIGNLLSNRIENELFVVTGFIGANNKGETTTLGRNKSDYSAAIIAAALDAKRLEIWKDVDGIMSADPKIVTDIITFPFVSYDELLEAAFFGAKVVNPYTFIPAMKKNIPIAVKNTFNDNAPGTVISKKIQNTHENLPVKMVTSIDDITLVNIKGIPLIGIPGTAARVFEATRDTGVNVIFASQASSEYTITIGIKSEKTEQCVAALQKMFAYDIKNNAVTLETIPDQIIVTIVGDGMEGTPGIAGRLLKTLGDNRINVSAIAQGSSENSISVTTHEANKRHALNVVHEAFIHPNTRQIFLIGTGNVGMEVLHQMKQLHNAHVMVRGIINTRVAIQSNTKIDLSDIDYVLTEIDYDYISRGTTPEHRMKSFIEWMKSCYGNKKILVDCSDSKDVASHYFDFIRAGFHIVAANKWFNTGELSDYTLLRQLLYKAGKKFKYSATVGAGLPVIDTIQTVKQVDVITKIECAPSGTINFVFSQDCSFSDAVQQAKKLKITEPNPRIDLNGSDVFGKMITLRKEIGWYHEAEKVYIENLTPITDKPFESYNRIFSTMVETAGNDNCVVRYVAEITEFEMTAQLKMVPKDSKMGLLKGTENIFMIYTEKRKEPIVISGEGAGKEITAAAVIADILKI